MKIKHHDFHIDREHPFTNCKLGREKYANILTQIVGNYKDGFVLAINNEWGTGKTTFVKMWQQQLVNKGYNTLYFNSWENDFDANPLVAIMSELKTLTKKDSKTFESLISKGAVISKNVLPQIIKAVANRYIDSEEIKVLLEKTSEGAADVLTDEIKEYAEKKKGLKEFKGKLEKYISETNKEKPLIFIIDELDRCRPTYAVELLEQIKHLFSVPGIVFVLSIDKIQLGHAVRGVYGSERINADEYLRRFIDVEYTLPKPNAKDFCSYLYDYFEFALLLNSPIRRQTPELNQDQSIFLRTSVMLFGKSNISLRQQEKIFSHSRIGLSLFKINEYIFPGLYLALVFLKNFHNDLYEKIKEKKYTAQILLNKFAELMPNTGLNDEEVHSLILIEAQLVHFYNNYVRNQNTYSSILYINPSTQEKTIRIESNLENVTGRGAFKNQLVYLNTHGNLDQLAIDHFLNKIDLSENIVIQ